MCTQITCPAPQPDKKQVQYTDIMIPRHYDIYTAHRGYDVFVTINTADGTRPV